MRIHAARGTDSLRKNRLAKALALAVVAASLGSEVSARADTYGNNGGTTLNLPASWIDETTPANTGIGVPGAGDIAQWDNNDVNAAVTTYTLGADTSWLGIKIVNPTAGVVIGTGVNNLTLGASGIDLSTATQNLTVATLNLVLGSSQSFTVATGRTLTVSAPVNLGGNTLTFAGAGATVVSGTVSDTGSGALVIGGSSTVTLSGTNTFAGGTTLNAGTLVLNNAAALGTGTFTIAGGTINSTTAGTTLNNNAQAINGSFTFTGTQSLNLGTGAVTLGATPTITVTANTLTEGGVISGGFGLTKAGAGTLVLTAANTFTGPVSINAGVVNFNSLAALGAGTVLNFNGGTLQYASGNTADISTDTVNFTGNAILDTNANSVTLANSIGNGGSGNFVKTGTGVLTLAAADNYSGSTTVQGSNATVASVLNFPTLASLGSGSAINISNGTLQYGSGNTADITARTVTVSGTLATIDVNGNSVTYANPISGTGTLTLASTAGPATVTFNAPTAYAGNITVNSGVTAVTGNALAFQSAGVTLNSGSTLNFGTATAVTLGGLSGAQNVALVNASSQNVTLTLGGVGGNYTGVLSDNGSNLAVTKIGTGNQILTNGNTYNGDTIIDGGELELNFTPATIGSNILYQQVLTGSVVQGHEGRLVLGGGELFVTNHTNATTYQQFASTVVNAGSSQVAMLGRSSGSKPETLLYAISRNVGGTVEFDPSTGNGSGIFTTSTNNASGILGGWAVYGGTDWARAATTAGPVLGGVASGLSIINGATYTTAATPATAFANATINTDMTANLTAPSNNTTGSIRFNNPGTIALTTTGANVDASGGILVTAAVAGNAISIIPASSSSTITSGNGADLIVTDNDTTIGSTFTIQTTIANNSAGNGTAIGLTKSGAGTLIVSGNNTFTGGVYLNAGTTVLGNAGAFNSANPNAIVFSSAYTNAPATLSLNGNSLVTPSITAANVAGTPVIQNASATSAVLTVNGSGASNFSGNIVNGTGAGTLGVTLAGSGSLTLSGSNTYTGDTVISSGTTLVLSSATNNISNSANIRVNGGGTLNVTGVTGGFSIGGGQTLTGSGTVSGTVIVPSAGILNPGTLGVGTLTATGLTLATNGVVNFDFAATSNDLVNVTGTNGLTFNGTAGSVKLNLYQNNTSTAFTTAGTYNLFEYVGSIGGTGLSALTDADLPFGYSATFGTASSGGNQYVTVTLGTSAVTVPTWALTGGGSWNVAADWTPPTTPNAVGQTALLGSAITAPSTVTLDGVQTIGTLAFNNANSYTVAPGTGGSLIFSNGSSPAAITDALGNHSVTAPISLASNLTASLTAGSVTLAGVVSEATPGKTITMSGAGTLALTNANTYTGGTFIGSGTVQVGNNAALGTGSLTFSSNGNLQAGAAGLAIPNNIAIASSTTATIDTQAQTLTLSGVISSADTSGGLTKVGPGTLIITGTNTLTNTVTVSAGTLQLGNGVTTGSFPGVIVNNATVAFNTAASYADGNTITGTGQVVQNAANTLTLSGANTFSGGLVINNNGTVVLAGNNNTDQAAGTGTITLNNGTLMVNGATGSTTPQYGPLTNTIYIPAGATGTVDNASRGDISSTIIGSGTLNYGTVYVRGTIGGDWSQFTGSVNFGANTAGFPSAGDYRTDTTNFNASNAFFTVNTGGFFYASVANSAIQLGDLTGNGTIGSGSNGTLALSIGNIETAGVTTTFTGTITNGTGATSLTKNGAGILDLAGINSFTGALTVTNGTLEFLGASQYPTATPSITLGSATTTGILDLSGFNSVSVTTLATVANPNAANNIISSSSTTAPTAINFATGTSTFGGTLQDSINGGNQTLSLTINSGSLTLSGNNTFTGGTTINGGTLQLGAGGTTGSIVATAATNLLDNGNLIFNRSDNITFAAAITGSGNITQAGPGVLTLTNTSNAYTGTVTITGGTLQLVSGVALGNSSSPLVVTAGTLDLNGNSITVGSLTGGAAGSIDNVAAGGNPILTTGSLGTSTTFAGVIKNTTGTVGLTKVGGGVLTLSGANTFGGPVDIQGGTIKLAGAGTLGSTAPVTVEAGAILDVNGVSPSIGSLNGAGTVDSVTSATPSVLTTGSLNATANFSGVIQNTTGSIALVKTGTGTLTLSGTNTFTGGTTVNSGSLYVNNTAGSGLGSGAVTLNGGILGGSGAITGPVAAGSGAHSINPGAAAGAIGTLTLGGLTTNANTTLGFDLSSPAGTSDLLAVTGNVDISAGASVAVTSQTVTGAASLGYYKVVSYTGTLTTGGTVALPAAANNIVYTLDTVHDTGFIDIHRGYIGDANDDGKVDLTDLNIILNNLGTSNTSWGKGNFDGAATIDLTDLNDVLNHLGTSIASGSAVVATPEPASLGLLALGAAALIARRRKA